MKIVIASEHAGYQLKEMLREYIKELGYDITDLGVFTDNEPVEDYPFIARDLGKLVAKGEHDRGILVCGTGIGMVIAVNKVPGVRAAVCNELFSAKKSREHNNANVLGLGSRIIGSGLAKEIVKLWLETGFEGGRHTGRVEKYHEIENEYLKIQRI